MRLVFLLRLYSLIIEAYIMKSFVHSFYCLSVLVVYFCQQGLISDDQLLGVCFPLFHLIVPIFLNVLEKTVNCRQLLLFEPRTTNIQGLLISLLFPVKFLNFL